VKVTIYPLYEGKNQYPFKGKGEEREGKDGVGKVSKIQPGEIFLDKLRFMGL
jgi:hypothetical protein